MEWLTCKQCGRRCQYVPARGHLRDRCNSCSSNRGKTGFKERVVQYLGGHCKVCGYDKCIFALQAHHRDPKEKKFTISSSHCRRWAIIQRELDKCDLLCAKCHAEEHSRPAQRDLERRKAKPETVRTAWPTKQRLQQRLHVSPITAVAHSLGVSEAAVRKHCKRLGIKTKGKGAWGRNGSTGPVK